MPPQQGRAGGLAPRPCQYGDYRLQQAQEWQSDWVYWSGRWWTRQQMQAWNDAYWQGQLDGRMQ
eukprot:12298122-Alexandrium_andersonii.AAC.1